MGATLTTAGAAASFAVLVLDFEVLFSVVDIPISSTLPYINAGIIWWPLPLIPNGWGYGRFNSEFGMILLTIHDIISSDRIPNIKYDINQE